ncbi:MAG: Photosystem I reaction center subunit III [Cyanothece sp. SIO2G6]|nr:Photosystem I reaction center subunit III [Cyanothece sp. SIO2G6]
MRRLLALALVLCLWMGFAASASADVAGLTPCSESPEFQELAEFAETPQAQKRFEFYASSGLLCGDDGLPHLIVDGRLSHAGEFIIPGILFLYIAGWIGWVGRAYLIKIREEKKPEMKEIIIDVPLAFSIMLTGFSWPLAAFGELTSGKLTVSDDEITVSPR